MPHDRTTGDRTDHALIGKIAEVTGQVASGTIGEVMVSVRGGSEAFYALPAEGETIDRGTKVLIIEYRPPRTVVVTPYPDLEQLEGAQP